MAAQDFSQYTPAQGFSGFNYNNEQDKIKRQRAIADQLANQASAPDGKPQFVQSSMGTFYAGGNPVVMGISKILGGLLAGKERSDADTSQTNLDSTSQAALVNQLTHMGDGHDTTTTTDAGYSPSKDSNAANVGTQDTSDPDTAQSFPVPDHGPMVSTPLPLDAPSSPAPVQSVSPAVKAQISQQLGGGPQAAPMPGAAAGAAQNGPPMAVPQVPPPAAPMAPPPQTQGPVTLPPAPTGGSPPEPSAPPPINPPSLPTDPAAAIAAANPGGQITKTTTVPPSEAEMVARLSQLAQTGPTGAQVASAKMTQMFGSKNGRYDMKFDPVNGGAIILDTATGQPVGIAGSGGHGKFDIVKQPDGTMMKVYQNGSPSEPVTTGTGAVVKDAGTVRDNAEATSKLQAKQQSYSSAAAAIQSQLSKLDEMDGLYDKTATGVVEGALPNWTEDRQRLAQLTGNNNFAGVREAVDGAGEGAQKFTQTEFKAFEDKNMSMYTKPNVAHSIIQDQRTVLLKKLQSLQAAAAGTPTDSTGATAPAPSGSAGTRLDWKR